MSTKLLNIVSLDGGVIIKKGSGGGGGVTINNQSKSVDIVENGTTEVTADTGYTGLGKVTINTNVASSGGGSDIPVIGDGKTYLYIKIAEKGRMNVPLYFSQTVANGVTIDWGDGSAPQTLSGTGNVNTAHTYADVGEYVISLNPADGCTLGLGHRKVDFCAMGPVSTYDANYGYTQMLVAVEWGHKASVTEFAFYNCQSLKTVIITAPLNLINLNEYTFCKCTSLANLRFASDLPVVLKTNSLSQCVSLEKLEFSSLRREGTCTDTLAYSGVRKIIIHGTADFGPYSLSYMHNLVSVEVLGNVSYIGNSAFQGNSFATLYNFSHCTSVPTLEGTSAFKNIPSDCKIIVPDDLYSEWIAATNWSTYASYIVKASEFNG